MKKFWEKLQEIGAYILGIGGVVLGFLFIFVKNKSPDATLAKDEVLKDQVDALDEKIDTVSTDIDTLDISDLSDDDIEDYWND